MRYAQRMRLALLAAFMTVLPLAAQGDTSFYDNGQLKQKVTLLRNGHDRIVETYHENGQLAQKALYRKGKLLSMQKWGSNGKPSIAWQQDAGARAGRCHGMV